EVIMNDSTETVHRIISQAKGVRSSKNGYTFCCPCHDDRHPSAQLTIGNKRIFLKCRAGCTEEQMCADFGIDTSELYFTPYKKFDPNWNLDHKIQTNYFYTDENDKVLYEHPRMKQRTDKDPKCLYSRPLGDGSYVWTLDAGWCQKKGRDYFLVR